MNNVKRLVIVITVLCNISQLYPMGGKGTQDNKIIHMGSFAGMNLGQYHADFISGTNVYFNIASMKNSAPTDLFVTAKPEGSKTILGKVFAGDKTQFIMSLVSGQVYDKAGPKFSIPIAGAVDYAKAQSVYWRLGLKDLFKNLVKSYNAPDKA